MGAMAREELFRGSAVTLDNRFYSHDDTLAWIRSRVDASPFRVERAPLAELDGWSFEANTGNLVHRSGKFFRVEGLRIHTNVGSRATWEQPIIDQPEIGILGIVARAF